MSNSALEFKDMSFGYPYENDLFMELNVAVQPGEFVSIIGASGSGKSTLFKLTVGLEEPTRGSIRLDGEKKANRLGHVGYMPQQDLLLPWRSILDNAALPLEIKGVSKKEAHKRIIPLLDEFGLNGTRDKFPSELSGGMRQRVSFLRTVLSGSPILLLDEPFSALDAITKVSMQEWLLQQWEKQGSTIIFITHDVDEALFLADRVFVLTETPIKELKEVTVPLNRPRRLEDLYSADLLEVKKDLMFELRSTIT
ncbi:ABC transporter ATP-binding protein [Salipaludibacillus neizhouensis]|uniref:ABC transporter ATP-binding protein n=1 Tax=Salipaludibacillus neizhouensis TaxID=885475 RepID=A0A3A9KPP3_9BACI|nr:ABC transporter ATP-binding protein [Salipaludibacillus neizhouensis]RKL66666.1 ABC transporter ATP-binding protein [Salipaludibacillus neizhouensis]